MTCTGAAWLSAVRVVKCFVNSFNGRNLQLYLMRLSVRNIATLILKLIERRRSQIIMAYIGWATHVLQW